jgi:hypothetical protein
VLLNLDKSILTIANFYGLSPILKIYKICKGGMYRQQIEKVVRTIEFLGFTVLFIQKMIAIIKKEL